MVLLLAASLLAAFAPGALAQVSAYGQCGGQGYSGSTTCVSGYTCTYSNPYYSQCLPGSAPATTTAKGTTTTTPHGITTTSTRPPSSTPNPPPTTTGTGASPGQSTWSTLQTGQLWIRAVESPYFHYYLQSESLNGPGNAVIGPPSTAGQFNVVSGQLVQYTPYGNTLYASVYPAAAGTNRLKLFFQTSPATNVTWSFSGDALTATVPGVKQNQGGIWLACTDDSTTRLQAYVNLGNYDYQTPSGCGDETLNYYNGPTAVS